MSFLLRSLRSAVGFASAPSSSSPAIGSSSRSAALSNAAPSSQRRHVSLVSAGSVRSTKGARKARTRVGRGEGAQEGEGKGRGTKGQGARAGRGTTRAFEGGQTPLTRMYPKRGFFNFKRKQYEPISLGTLQEYIDLRRLDPTEPITVEHIFKAGVVSHFKRTNGWKLLATGFDKLKQPLTLVPHRASEAAIAAVEATGGSVTAVYHNRLSFRQAIHPEKYQGHLRVREALPMKKRDILYYTSWDKRGYLAQRPADFDPLAAAARVLVQPEPKTMHETTGAYSTGKGK